MASKSILTDKEDGRRRESNSTLVNTSIQRNALNILSMTRYTKYGTQSGNGGKIIVVMIIDLFLIMLVAIALILVWCHFGKSL